MDTEDLPKLLNGNKVDYVVIGGAALPVKFLKQIKERQDKRLYSL